jgi:hypothetical protein
MSLFGGSPPSPDDAHRAAMNAEFEQIAEAAQQEQIGEGLVNLACTFATYRRALMATGSFDAFEAFCLVRDFATALFAQQALNSYLDGDENDEDN